MSGPVLGLCLPPRPRPGEAGFDAPERWGCLQPALQQAVMAQLQAESPWTLRAVDFRDAHVESGALMLDGAPLHEQLDALFWYCEIDRGPDSYGLSLLQTLARHIPVSPDPHRWAQAMDKYTAHCALRAAGAPVAEFLLADLGRLGAARGALERWGAAVLKPRRGAWGKGVLLVEDWPTLRDVADYMRATSPMQQPPVLFMERYYDNDLDRWASLTMVGRELMYGYRKRASKRAALGGAGGRAKILDALERGGEADRCDLDPRQIAAAERACAALDLPVVGFDMIWTAQGPIIVDENTSPGNYAEIYAEAGIDPASAWARAILREVGGRLRER